VSFGLVWIVPFVGLLLSIAVMPLAAPGLWHRHFGKIAAFWAVAFALPFAALCGLRAASAAVLEVLVFEYVPFVILLTALFTVAGGIRLTGSIRGTPGVNTLMLLIGTVAASIMGTTGAAMLILRPLIRANRQRRYNTHVFVFFIFLVANIGGALSPLGDPPLLLGFLQGVPFFWPTVHLFLPMVLMAAPLLVIFHILDRRFHRRGWHEEVDPLAEIERLGIDGKINLVLLLLIPAVVFATGEAGAYGAFEALSLRINPATLLGNLMLVGIAAASLRLTSQTTRDANHFSWRPMLEVAKLFAAIFITIIPALAILRAGPHGPLAPLVGLLGPGPGQLALYFWLTGGLSSLLDNAPTYLVFFNLADAGRAAFGEAPAGILAAISAGAVFMGANTYIGNAPNFMVKAMCEERGVTMPSFFGYLVWSGTILIPLYLLVTAILFH